jgi:protein-disulfide isomerase
VQRGINSTPTLIVNGQPIVGVPEYEQLRSVIEAMAATAGLPT